MTARSKLNRYKLRLNELETESIGTENVKKTLYDILFSDEEPETREVRWKWIILRVHTLWRESITRNEVLQAYEDRKTRVLAKMKDPAWDRRIVDGTGRACVFKAFTRDVETRLDAATQRITDLIPGASWVDATDCESGELVRIPIVEFYMNN